MKWKYEHSSHANVILMWASIWYINIQFYTSAKAGISSATSLPSATLDKPYSEYPLSAKRASSISFPRILDKDFIEGQNELLSKISSRLTASRQRRRLPHGMLCLPSIFRTILGEDRLKGDTCPRCLPFAVFGKAFVGLPSSYRTILGEDGSIVVNVSLMFVECCLWQTFVGFLSIPLMTLDKQLSAKGCSGRAMCRPLPSVLEKALAKPS